MQDIKHLIGKMGEETAISFLKRKGYKLLEKNFRTRNGEIDLIVYKNKTIVFVEVKTRKFKTPYLPEDSVNIYKQRKISAVAKEYLLKKELPEYNFLRFDVITIRYSGRKKEEIEHYEGAFLNAF